MANTILKYLNNQNKAFHVLGLFCFVLLMQKGSAREFTVGGSNGWAVPGSTTSYNQWAENSRFQIGDSLVFVYPSGQDSVLRVTNDAYTNCITDAPIEKFTDGHTVFIFNQSGPFYFISGNKDNCIKNQKLVVVVLADRSNSSSNTLSPPSPAPVSTLSPPSPAPVSTLSPPSPAPAGMESPPAGTPEGSPPASAASTKSFIGSIGAFVASSLILVF